MSDSDMYKQSVIPTSMPSEYEESEFKTLFTNRSIQNNSEMKQYNADLDSIKITED